MKATSENLIQLTESAANQVKTLLAKEPDAADKHLRLYVEPGGCSGKQYGMVFDQRRDGDLTVEQFGLAVVVDSISAEHLRGSTVDYLDALNGGGFKITNPNARGTCGCGNSFET